MEYGQKVSKEEIDRIFQDEIAKEEQKRAISGELSSLEVGECIAYPKVIKSKNLSDDFEAFYAIQQLLPPKGKFKVIERKDKIYIYRQK